jgi:hypothetical protein
LKGSNLVNAYSGLLVGLATFDLFLLALCYWMLRASAPDVTRRALFPVGVGMAGFVFHAFMFFEGGFLFLQLATCAGIFGLYLLASRRRPNVTGS